MKNKYLVNNDGSITIFANCKGVIREIIIDKEDFSVINKATNGSWYVKSAKGTLYALFCIRNKKENKKDVYVYMHRLIMKLIECEYDKVLKNTGLDLVVDHHPNHYGLDNRRNNLKVVTFIENLKNRQKKK